MSARFGVLAQLTCALVVLAGCSSASISGAGYRATASDSELTQDAGSLQVVGQLPPPSGGVGSGQVVRIGDKLSIAVFGVDSLSGSAQVDGNGMASFPLIGQVAAAGRTLDSFQADVTARYASQYLQNPQITITLEQTVTLDGEFRRAGAYPAAAGMTLLRAIATAGNFTDVGDPSNVFVYRTVNGQDYVAQYNASEVRAGRRPDVQLFGGDIVVAFPSGMKVIGRDLREAFGLARSATILF